ncbi:rifampicin phosphotransferase-like isoform X2 [Halichondria panicea]|uniref:rifampicin phosphotransferase-like isoform X2 n=1 Tax=Halichondria panicea TaxID=6063 RepID=UPI00312BC310
MMVTEQDSSSIPIIIDSFSESCDHSLVGGKARNLWLLGKRVPASRVPDWFCVTTEAFTQFIQGNKLKNSLSVDSSDVKGSSERVGSLIMDSVVPGSLKDEIAQRLGQSPYSDGFVAVRSSGTDEDSSAHSFAGQFESYLFQSGGDMILKALKKCWSSCFSERVMRHRLDNGMPTTGLRMAVIIQVMVNSAVSGVAFSRHPLSPITKDAVLVEAVYGLGEGLVSGELEADRYEVSRQDFKVVSELAEKPEKFVQDASGGLRRESVEEGQQKTAALTDEQAVAIAKLLVDLEDAFGTPLDFEWGIEKAELYSLQARPIVTLPPTCFFDGSVPGNKPLLWDNSNIVESYAGVTSPLTFSFISHVYMEVYVLTLREVGVPSSIVSELRPNLENMLGLIRGNVYYNMISWYRCLTCIPVGDTSKYMETMMGVKQNLGPEMDAILGKIRDTAPKYSLWDKSKVFLSMLHKIYYIDSLVSQFFTNFNTHYADALATDFDNLSLPEQVDYIKHLYKNLIGKWEVPVMNDTYVMLFFGLLKKLVGQWMNLDSDKAQSLQNDLLCGQGDVESTEPTKSLMRIAEYIDTCEQREELRVWFAQCQAEVMDMLAAEEGRVAAIRERARVEPIGSTGLRQRKMQSTAAMKTEATQDSSDPLHQSKVNVVQSIRRFLSKYGFRCINELKLEEKTLHDDPSFVLNIIAGYVRTKHYSISNMEEREKQIRVKAEDVVNSTLPFPKRIILNWVLFHARRGVRHRENTRFARTKLFGVFRTLFRSIGKNLTALGLLKDQQDVFYLTTGELFAFVDGRGVTNHLAGLVELRRQEYDGYKKSIPPPERFITRGAVTPCLLYPAVLTDLDLLQDMETAASADPDTLTGTPCCPGVVEGVVRVVNTINETQGLDGEILVTARTDPGWVPLYPLCSGLVIERGSCGCTRTRPTHNSGCVGWSNEKTQDRDEGAHGRRKGACHYTT